MRSALILVFVIPSVSRAEDRNLVEALRALDARAGCLVLVPDHLGHGERRQHPFGEDGPHDYHGR
jgi:hypothetical protein